MALVDAVENALAELDPAKVDLATGELALTYARRIDNGGSLEKLGPQLLTVLEALLMTPKARSAIVKGVKDERKSPLDELRARRAKRQRDTSSVDASAS